MTRRAVDVVTRGDRRRIVARARWCESAWSRLLGLMFRRSLHEGEALVLVEAGDSRLATAIHMFFVPFPIAAIWINSAGQVVDKVLALPWRPMYMAVKPAKYVLEAAPDTLEKVSVGDEVVFENCGSALR
jgi:uncharacterized protein